MPASGNHATSDDSSDLADKLRPGSRVGRYRLLALLGTGGMAYVWAATPEGGAGLARTVALKVVRPELAEDDEYSRLFIDEATIAASIHHPNVAETYELGRHGKTLFMAMEWVAGESLSGLLRVKRSLVPIDLKIAVRIVADACAGLHAAHQAIGPDGSPLNVVHRDVSPPNVLVSVHGQVKVSDFGVAKARHQLHERTRTGEVKGKFGYLAPEQITGKKVDRRVDVYALGCVMYVATLGLRPFGSGPEAMGKILTGQFKLPREIDPDYPPELETILLKALSSSPDDRYQTAEEMRKALERWLLDNGYVVTSSDISDMVRQRMSPKASEAIDSLLSMSKVKPNMAYELLMQMQTEEQTETPTATSGLVAQPPGIREIGSEDLTILTKQSPDDDDGPTLLADLSGRQSAPGTQDKTMPAMRHRLAQQYAGTDPKSSPSSSTKSSAERAREPSRSASSARRNERVVSDELNNGVQALIAVLVMALVLGVWALLR